MKSAAQLEREIIASGNVVENRWLMIEVLSAHFGTNELDELDLLDLCQMYTDLAKQEGGIRR